MSLPPPPEADRPLADLAGVPSLDDIFANLAALETADLEVEYLGSTGTSAQKYVDNISALKASVEAERIEDAVGNFVEHVSPEVLMVASMGLDEVHAIEQAQAKSTLERVSTESKVHRKRLEEIKLREISAQERIVEKAKLIAKAKRQVEAHMLLQTRKQRDMLQAAFIKAETHLLQAVKRRQGEVRTFYGDLALADSRFTGHEGRRFRVDWSRSPQPIEIKLHRLCGMRDKVPHGKYVLTCSLYDRLGGNVMRWKRLRGQEWHGSTMPMNHGGRWNNVKLEIEQSLFTTCPSEHGVRPGMVLLFELYLLRGSSAPKDLSVGWGAFPLIGPDFQVVNGKFKLPMLRGPMTSAVTTHDDIQDTVKENLNKWLCNCYFEVVKKPRYVGAQKEFEVELQYTSGILGYPERSEDKDEAEKSNAGAGGDDDDDDDDGEEENDNIGNTGRASSFIGENIYADPHGRDAKTAQERAHDRLSKTLESAHIRESGRRKSTLAERLGSTEIGDIDLIGGKHEEETAVKDEIQFQSSNEESGLSYVIRPDFSNGKRFVLRPGIRKAKLRLTENEKRAEYKQTLRTTVPGAAGPDKPKLTFMKRQFFSELGIREARTREFWIFVAMLVLVFWLRMWMHALAQWMYLQMIEIQVTTFKLELASVNLQYHDNMMSTGEVLGLVFLGVFANNIAFLCLMLASSAWQSLVGRTSWFASSMVCAFGIGAFLDPVLMLVTDLVYGKWEDVSGKTLGDFCKLFYHLKNSGDSGVAGILFTVFLYMVLMSLSAAMFYWYFLRLHHCGRNIDLYIRLTSDEDKFFLPHDAEVSAEDLTGIVKKAEKWRGKKGQRRKVVVQDYIFTSTDEDDPDDVTKIETETVTLIALFELALDGERELHRQFLMENGSIIEVFDQIDDLLKKYSVREEERKQQSSISGAGKRKSGKMSFGAAAFGAGTVPNKNPSVISEASFPEDGDMIEHLLRAPSPEGEAADTYFGGDNAGGGDADGDGDADGGEEAEIAAAAAAMGFDDDAAAAAVQVNETAA